MALHDRVFPAFETDSQPVHLIEAMGVEAALKKLVKGSVNFLWIDNIKVAKFFACLKHYSAFFFEVIDTDFFGKLLANNHFVAIAIPPQKFIGSLFETLTKTTFCFHEKFDCAKVLFKRSLV